jgi:hypothetical protein
MEGMHATAWGFITVGIFSPACLLTFSRVKLEYVLLLERVYHRDSAALDHKTLQVATVYPLVRNRDPVELAGTLRRNVVTLELTNEQRAVR